MTNKERAEATYEALQKRKMVKLRNAKANEINATSATIDSIYRRKGRKSLKYFF